MHCILIRANFGELKLPGAGTNFDIFDKRNRLIIEASKHKVIKKWG